MDEKLQRIIDHYEITELLNEYCRGCDRTDPLRMVAVYASESWDDHGPNKCTGPEFAAYCAQSMAKVEVCSHFMGQSTIKVNGDTAGVESHFVATIRRHMADGSRVLDQLGGRYLDTLVRENGAWRIARRLCVRDWSVRHKLADDWFEGRGFIEGQKSADDPCYAVLGIEHLGSL